ncbi:MAG: hypothetical protein KatS3mg097_309 [Candidatus Parcubacteria bacterium]|nr:MAG: hypothetical protein KatS3mg097_309 [Candidatus Parcubacteria bacterium]
MNSDLLIEIIEKLAYSIDSKLDWDNPQMTSFVGFVYAIFQKKAYTLDKIQELIDQHLSFLNDEQKKIILATVQLAILEKLRYLKQEFDVQDEEDYLEETEEEYEDQQKINEEATFEERSKRYLEFMQDFFKKKESALLQKKDKISSAQHLKEDLNIGAEINLAEQPSLQKMQQFSDEETIVNLQKQEYQPVVENNEDLLVIAKDSEAEKTLEKEDVLNLNKDKQAIINQPLNQQVNLPLQEDSSRQTPSLKPKKNILIFWKSDERKESSQKDNDNISSNASEDSLKPTIIIKKKTKPESSEKDNQDSMLDLSNL